MATGQNQTWLKVLLGLIISIMLLIVSAGSCMIEKKLDKEVFDLHKDYLKVQFSDIKDSLKRIEEKP
jgi:hypothetical protein